MYLPIDECAFCLITGRRRSGKTALLIDIINNCKDMESIYIFSPNFDLDSSWNKLNKKIQEKIIYWTDLSNQVLEQIIEKQRTAVQFNGKNKFNQVLIVIDDFAMDLKKIKNINVLANNARHLNIHCIITTQKYNLASTIVRQNSTEKIFFNIDNEQEYKTVIDENSDRNIGIGGFENILSDITAREYHYLLCVSDSRLKTYYDGNKLRLRKIKIIE